MASTKFKSINAYPEWDTKEGIQGVKKFVQSLRNAKSYDDHVYPTDISKSKRKRYAYRQKYQADWVVEENELYYRPKINLLGQYRVNLRVVPPEEREEVMKDLYNDETKGSALGINAWYRQIGKNFIGISKEDATTFLKKQGTYQITRPIKKRVNRAVLATVPNERWMMDIFFMTAYKYKTKDDANEAEELRKEASTDAKAFPFNKGGKMKYVLTVVDVFSKKVWARALENKEKDTIVQQLRSIFLESRSYPTIMQSDNAKEFKPVAGDKLDTLYTNAKIKPVFSNSYTATSNGLVEKMNQELRKKIRDGFVRRNNLEWVEHLQTYVDNINNQIPEGQKHSPNEIWTLGNTKATASRKKLDLNDQPLSKINDKSSLEEIQSAFKKRQVIKAAKNTEKGTPISIFDVNDKVRISYKALDTKMRARYKTNQGLSYNAVRYTPEVFTVFRVLKPKRPRNFRLTAPEGKDYNVVRERYILKDDDGEVIKSGRAYKQFFGSDLIQSDENEVEAPVKSNARARVLNLFDDYNEESKNVTAADERKARQAKDKDVERAHEEKRKADEKAREEARKQREKEEAQRKEAIERAKRSAAFREKQQARQKKKEAQQKRKQTIAQQKVDRGEPLPPSVDEEAIRKQVEEFKKGTTTSTGRVKVPSKEEIEDFEDNLRREAVKRPRKRKPTEKKGLTEEQIQAKIEKFKQGRKSSAKGRIKKLSKVEIEKFEESLRRQASGKGLSAIPFLDF